MRSAGDFDAMWREMSQTDTRVWTIAHEALPHLFSTWEPRIEFSEQDDAYVLRAELPGMQRIFPPHFGERRTISGGYLHSYFIM